MKFHQLPIGARFRLRGTDMRKISPLKAELETEGSQKLVPRSAVVERLGDDSVALPGLPPQLHGQAVENGIQQLVADCRQAFEGVDPALDDGQREQLGAIIEAAAQKMLERLAGR